MMDKNYYSRPFEDSDLDGVIELRGIVFGKEKALNFRKSWNWYFNGNPVLKSYRPRSWVVEKKGDNSKNKGRKKGRIVGYISVTPGLLKIGNMRSKFVWGGDLMSDPEQRGKGIGKEMARRWKEEANICLALGVGDVAYDIESKMGWYNVDVCKAMIKILNPGSFIDYLSKTKKSIISSILSKPLSIVLDVFFRAKKYRHGSRTITEMKRFDNKFDDFWAEASKNLEIAVVRDKDYLNWKYTLNPARMFRVFAAADNRTKKIKGYAVLSKISSGNFNWGRIVDFVASPYDKDAMQALISHSIDHFRKEKCDGIQVYGMKKEHRRMFSRNGFIYSKSMKQRFIVKIDNHAGLPDQAYFKNPDNWFVTAGDSDFTI